MQNKLTTIISILLIISVNIAKIGSNEFFTPFTTRCAKNLLLSKNKFNVCWGESLKFLEIVITKNYKILCASLNCFFDTSVMSTLSGCAICGV